MALLDGISTLDEALALFPAARDRYRELEAELWADGRIDPATLELCRLRLCQLLGDTVGLGEGGAVAVPDEPAFDERTRACLAFTELYVIDAHAVTDDVCATLLAHLSEAEAVALTMALAISRASIE